jgi:peptide/nickel transport system permease protein
MVVFFVLRGMPGVDPLAAYIAPGLPISQEALQVLRKQLHLDEPLPVQYFYYVANLLRGDWGYSRTAPSPSSTRCSGGFPRPSSSRLRGRLSVASACPPGSHRGPQEGRAPDIAVRVVSITGISFPVFWLGIILQLVFFYYPATLGLPACPSAGGWTRRSRC